MEPEIIETENAPVADKHALSPFSSFIAAAGAAMCALTLMGSAIVASIWAFSKLLGLSDSVIFVLMALSAIPIVVLTFWTAGRAWHIEQRLAQGLDIDAPVFELTYYWRKTKK